MLRIADLTFPLESTSFSACISLSEDGWGVSWNLEFEATEVVVGDLTWKPSLVHHAAHLVLPNLSQLPGTTLQPPDFGLNDEPGFLLYVFEHEPIRNVVLSFGQWLESGISFNFNGVSDVFADEQYSGDLGVSIHCTLPFQGVTVDEHEEQKAKALVERFFPGIAFSFRRCERTWRYIFVPA